MTSVEQQDTAQQHPADEHYCSYATRFESPRTWLVDFDHMEQDACLDKITAFLNGAQHDVEQGHLPVMGCDMEWTTKTIPGTKKRVQGRVALLQLATTNHALMLRCESVFEAMAAVVKGSTTSEETNKDEAVVNQDATREVLPRDLERSKALLETAPVKRLIEFLSSDTVFKVGVGIGGDKTKLMADYNLNLGPCVDLVCLRNQATPSFVGKGSVSSLKNMTEAICGVKLAKCKSITVSDWGNRDEPLSQSQWEYALDDVCASFGLAENIITWWKEKKDHVEEQPTSSDVVALCTPLIDQAPPTSGKGKSSNKVGAKKATKGRKPEPKEGEMPGTGWFCGRQTQYYDNIRVLADDGEMYFTVDKCKADWYIRKGLADVTKRHPAEKEGEEGHVQEIKLKFTPNFGRFGDSHLHRNLDYFRAPKENKCVVCGNDDALVRHSIVPTAYRKYMPAAYVSHNSYDMVLVCVKCFPKLTYHTDHERHLIAEEYGFPLNSNAYVKFARNKQGADALQECSETAEDCHSDASPQAATGKNAAQESAEQQQCIHDVIKYASALHRLELSKAKRTANIPQERIDMMRDFVKEHGPKYIYPPMKKKVKVASKMAKKGGDVDTAESAEAEDASDKPKNSIRIDPNDPLSKDSLHTMMIANPALVARVEDARNVTDGSEVGRTCSGKDGNVNALPRDHDGRLPKVNPAVFNHGMHVMKHLIDLGEAEDKKKGKIMLHGVEASNVDVLLGAFIVRWRASFLKTMNPQHMPMFWEPDCGILVTDEVLERYGMTRSEQSKTQERDRTEPLQWKSAAPPS